MIDLTTGNPTKQMIRFTIPLFIGNIFQQLYNVIDSIIIGRFVNEEALAAVGATFAITTFITSLLIGLCMGAGILFSQFFGAKEWDKLKEAISTAFIFIMGLTLLLTLLTFFNTAAILRAFQMPESTFTYGKSYLEIIFLGLLASSLYNFFAFLLRAVGDSKTPLYFLVVACFVNIVLDLLFVVVFQWHVIGAAVATLISQIISALLCAGFSYYKLTFIPKKWQDWTFSWDALQQIAQYSLLTSIQQAVMNFGILLVQGFVNGFGAATMAGFAIAVKIDAFAYLPVQDFGNAFGTFVAQNKGAKHPQRILTGFKAALKINLLFCVIISSVVLLLKKPLISLFIVANHTSSVLAIGSHYLNIVAPFYFFIGLLFLFYGFYRGLGKMTISIQLTFVSLGLRVVLAYFLSKTTLGFSGICWSIPVGWLIADLLGFYFYFKLKKLSPLNPLT